LLSSTTENILQQELQAHYNNMNRKLDFLQTKQQDNNRAHHNTHEQQFYTRTFNLTKTIFTKEEIKLLNDGQQYSIEESLRKY